MSTRAPAPAAAAFFDVDETLVRFKSMFRFLRYFLEQRGEPAGTYERLTGELHAAAARVPRAEVNRRYYRLFAGQDARRLAQAGASWFDYESVSGSPFLPETLREYRRHQAEGALTVLLSGSFFACLDPIADALGGRCWALGTRPVVRRGTLTGEVLTPLIGVAKGRAARATAAVRDLDLARCSAYGDHATDLPFLEAVGDPVVVGDDPVLMERAVLGEWRRLRPGTAPARRPV
ncbi:HAD family hydrolase [Actinomadura rubrisoli]|uniref:HAD-IB family hydrolase n=1 Tax=Actinomadura rubrisoli TaxID=2530368 RepID=A0A4R5C370_9ACTN|nr:HAD-IB family hydrolase [Actinomadura rubrisoli]TDD92493.1 HAD-IB family hydrolase [Actinomadura rubrisoli]